MMYHEILNHLTPNKERIELSGLVYAFCRFYCQYIYEVPKLKDAYMLYRQQAKRYGCWYVYVLLTIIGLIRRVGNPMKLLKTLHIIRWRLMEMPDVVFNRNKK